MPPAAGRRHIMLLPLPFSTLCANTTIKRQIISNTASSFWFFHITSTACLHLNHLKHHNPTSHSFIRFKKTQSNRGSASRHKGANPQNTQKPQKSQKQTPSSRQWLHRQHKDYYVKRSQEERWPSRSAFKLEEMNEIHVPSILSKRESKKGGGDRNSKRNNRNTNRRLIQPHMKILDLGAAPGGWSLYASTQIDPRLHGGIVAVDLLPLDENLHNLHMEHTQHTHAASDVMFRIDENLGGNFEFIQGDFTERGVHAAIVDALNNLRYGGEVESDGVDADSAVDADGADGAFGSADSADSANAEVTIDRTASSFQSENHHRKRPKRSADLVLSDMAPNFTGDSLTDALRTMHLCEVAFAFSAGEKWFDPSSTQIKTPRTPITPIHSHVRNEPINDDGALFDEDEDEEDDGVLADGGAFLCKYFSCGRENEQELMEAAKRAFGSVHVIKPKASRKESSEMYLLGLDYNVRR